jgi:lipopolysaccharide export system permease protein
LNSDFDRVAVVPKPRARAAVAGGQSRWLRWTLMDRYVLTEMIGPLLFGVALFTAIFVAGQFLFRLTNWVAQGAPVVQVLGLFGLQLVPMIVLTFPMAALLATLLAYGRLSGDMETTAMAASGIPFMRIAAPAFVLGLVVSLVGLGINELFVPPSGRMSEQLEAAILKTLQEKVGDVTQVAPGKAVVLQDFEAGKLARLVVAKGFDLREKKLRDVTMLSFTGDDVTAIVEADSAVWEEGQKWIFYNARFQQVNTGRGTEGAKPGAKRGTLRGRHVAVIELDLNKSPDEVLSSQKKPEDMSFAELRRYIEALKDQNVKPKALRSLEVDLYNKTSVPFASLVFTLIGTPLALRRLRGGASVGLGLSVLIIFLYYILWHGMTIMAEGGQMPPLWAAWGANLLGLLAGGVLIARTAH